MQEHSGLSPECQQRLNSLRQTFPSFEDFAVQYNPDTQILFAEDVRKTIMGNYSTLNMLDIAFTDNSSAKWLVLHINDLNKFSGSKNMDEKQAESLAYLLARKYKDMKFSILMLFFYKFKCGDFGRFYGKVDPMVITCALKDFVAECEAKKQEYLNEEYAEHKKEEQQWQELQNRAKGYWYRCQKSLVDDCPDDDGKELFSRVSFFVFYEDKRTLLLSASDSDYGMIENFYFDFFKEAIIKSFPNIRVKCIIKNKED